jgi:hypothetical protein
MPIKGTYYNATLGAAPTLSSQLGYVLYNTIATVFPSTNGLITSISLTPGTWIISWLIGITYTTLPPALGIYISSSPSFPGPQIPFSTTQTGESVSQFSTVYSTATSITLNIFISYTGGSGLGFSTGTNLSYAKTIRIA